MKERDEEATTHSFYYIVRLFTVSGTMPDVAAAEPRAYAVGAPAWPPWPHTAASQYTLLSLFNVSSNIPHVCLFGHALDIRKTKENTAGYCETD
jgi:hypothetical protein